MAQQGSELAIVTAEIVDILPREHQTAEMANWVESQLAAGNTASEMLEYCKNQFGIVVREIESCKLNIQNHGIKLDRHIEYVDQKFKHYDHELNSIKQELAVTSALGNERAQMQQFLTGQLMNQQTQIQSSVANVAAKAGRGDSSYSPVQLAFALAFGVILISCMVAFGTKSNTQTIEYKNVPAGGHPTPIPKEIYDRL